MSIIELPEAASLAIHSMVILAKNKGNLLTVKEMAEECGASQAHLAKVMQRLAKSGLVVANRGPKGGYQISPEGENATLLSIYEALEGPVLSKECFLKQKVCPFEKCIFGGVLEKAEREIKIYFAQTKLKDLVL